MTSNNAQHTYKTAQAQPALLVSTLGFTATIEDRLKALFQLERPAKPIYIWMPPTEPNISILLVNHDNPLAVQKKDRWCAGATRVAVSQGPLAEPPLYHLRGMLTAARVMAALDKIPLAAPPTTALQTNINSPPVRLELVPVPSKPPEPVATTAAGLLRYRALVVDDSAAIQKSLELKLVALAQIAAVDFADNGETALAMATATQYHLIFLDVMMPGLDGYETCARLRNNPEYKKTPIIMVSGKTSPLDEVKGIMAGCTTYLTKPVQEEAFHKLSLRVLAWLTARATDADSTRRG